VKNVAETAVRVIVPLRLEDLTARRARCAAAFLLLLF
jgi:hypothetical protein